MNTIKKVLLCSFLLTTHINAEDTLFNENIPSQGRGITTIKNIYGENIEFPYEIKNGNYIYQGDILLPVLGSKDYAFPQLKGVVTSAGSQRWANNTMPFIFDSSISVQAKSQVRQAAQTITDKTNLDVIEITASQTSNYPKYLKVIDDDYGCWSYVGALFAGQSINIHSTCGTSSAIHELLHAAGMWHEHSRLDRDSYVKINYQNIRDEIAYNFDKANPYYSMDIGRYNYTSIMHYSKYAGSINGRPTIEPLDASIYWLGGNQLTSSDISTINTMYPPIPPVNPIAAAKVTDYFGNDSGWTNDKYPRMVADIDGDGKADLIGFEYNRVITATNIDSGITLNLNASNDFVLAKGWTVDKHPRMLADINGDGMADIVGFGDEGVYTALANGDGTFASANLVLTRFGYNQGWRTDRHPRLLGDINGDGVNDIMGFANKGVSTAVGIEEADFLDENLVIDRFGYFRGWRIEKHPRLLGDINGDGINDIIGFANNGVDTALATGDGGFSDYKLGISYFGYNQGWRIDLHERSLTDLNEDVIVDIIAFGDNGTYISLSNGDGTFSEQVLTLNQFGYNRGWITTKNPRLLSDINGDSLNDIIGFGNKDIYTALSNGDGTFSDQGAVLEGFGYNDGWRVGLHKRYLADVNGDGMADVVGFGADGVYIVYSNGFGGFTY